MTERPIHIGDRVRLTNVVTVAGASSIRVGVLREVDRDTGQVGVELRDILDFNHHLGHVWGDPDDLGMEAI